MLQLLYALPVAFAAALSWAAVRRRTERVAHTAVLAATAAILLVTLTPQGGANEIQERPFAEIASALRRPFDAALLAGVVGNVLMFVPLGAALAVRTGSAARALATGAVLSAGVELAQLVVPGRTTAVDDFLLNCLGTCLGALLATALDRRGPVEGPLRSRSTTSQYRRAGAD